MFPLNNRCEEKKSTSPLYLRLLPLCSLFVRFYFPFIGCLGRSQNTSVLARKLFHLVVSFDDNYKKAPNIKTQESLSVKWKRILADQCNNMFDSILMFKKSTSVKVFHRRDQNTTGILQDKQRCTKVFWVLAWFCEILWPVVYWYEPH